MLLLLLLLLLLAGDPDLTDPDREILKDLSAARETPAFVFHYDPRTLKPAALERAAKANQALFEGLRRTLKMEFEGRIHMFLYADAAEMKARTKSDAPAFSRGTRSIHQPHDYDDAHEIVHVFALQFPRGPDSVPPDPFFVEGLATALQREDQGVPIDSWAAVAERVGRIPPLVEFRRSWTWGAPPAAGCHPYHVAGSFLSFLVSRYGVEKVKALYANCMECQGILGRSFALLEQDWRAWLRERKVPAKEEDHVLRSLGIPRDRLLPPALAAAKGTPLFDGKSLDGWEVPAPGNWAARDGLLVGRADGAWDRIRTKRTWKSPRGVRVRFRLVSGNALQVSLNRTERNGNEAVLAGWGTFLCRGDAGGSAFAKSDAGAVPGRWTTAVFANDGGEARLWVDGVLALAPPGRPLVLDEGGVGLGVERGVVEFSEVTLLE